MERFHAVALVVLLALAPATVAVPPAAHGPPAAAAAGAGPTAALPPAASTPTPAAGSSASPAATRAGGPAALPVVPQENTSEFLALPADERVGAEFETATIDVSGALAADSGALEGEFDRRWVDGAYANASTEAERRAALRSAADRIERHADDLHAQERAALEAYNADDLSVDAYLRTLAAIDAEARALEGATDRLEERASDFSNRPVSGERVGQIYAQVRSRQGPIRERVGRTISGRNDSVRVYIETSTTGVVLAMIDSRQNRYIREAYIGGVRDAEASDQFKTSDEFFLDAVEVRFQELYPWTANHTDQRNVGDQKLNDGSIYPVTITHPHGELTAFFDGGTTDVFLEYQRLDLDQVPTGSQEVNTSDDLRLQVDKTRVGGPLLVQVTDNRTGDPVDTAVEIDGERIGTTGEDGRLWAVTPQARFTVNATVDGREVSMETFSRRPDQS